ncbi:hypothetical protein HCU74_02305 [Spongiibacter sp. KMU-166]|uniref:Lipoprotein n=1 Tax=Spongiibacter thalassae TaxID=2721624 RepID=A0ABX1GAQ7_9GAMM|nr:hypothetical protein [Spongiibacter thalassae]NKI16244.1 hypothetical protein [Spongiibacter thalassae]
MRMIPEKASKDSNGDVFFARMRQKNNERFGGIKCLTVPTMRKGKMMKKIVTLITFATLASGCSVLNKPKLYGNDSCKNPDKTAYVYSSGNAAVCLKESAVAYMICARELGILSAKSSGGIKGKATVDVAGQGKADGSAESSKEVIVIYADKGPLAVATADAIRTCIQIHDNYNGV